MKEISMSNVYDKGYISRDVNNFGITMKYTDGYKPIPIPFNTIIELFPAMIHGCIFDSTSSTIEYDEEVSTVNNEDIFEFYKESEHLVEKSSYIFNVKIKMEPNNLSSSLTIDTRIGKLNKRTMYYRKQKMVSLKPILINLTNNELVELYHQIKTSLMNED